MTPAQRAAGAFDYFLQHGWVKEENRKAISEGIELVIRSATVDAEQEAEPHRAEIERMAAKIAAQMIGTRTIGTNTRRTHDDV